MAWSAEKGDSQCIVPLPPWSCVGWAPGGMPGDSVCLWTL